MESDSEVTVQNTKKRKISIIYSRMRNLSLKKRREKRKHSLRVTMTSSQTMNPNINRNRCASKKMSWKDAANLQENTHAKVRFT